MTINKEKVIQVLSSIVDESKISGVVIDGGKIGFAIEDKHEPTRLAAEKAVFAIPGVEKVTAVLTGVTGKISVENKGANVIDRKQSINGVKKIIAVASGKGGVGKSTIAYNLALEATKQGLKVGLVDADIYGPSIPHLLKLDGKPDLIDNFMRPHERDGIVANSIGFLVDQNEATIWRGPMATKAIHQLFRGTKWDVNGELDILFIDMPPGTGDIHLSIAQNYPIDGAIVVTTPHELALADVRKALKMYERVNTPVLGVLENMSYFLDASGNKNYIFGQNGGSKLSNELGLRFLGEVPIGEEFNLSGVIDVAF